MNTPGIIAAVVGVLFLALLAWFCWWATRMPRCPMCGKRKLVQEYQTVGECPDERCMPFLRCENCGMRKVGAIMLF